MQCTAVKENTVPVYDSLIVQRPAPEWTSDLSHIEGRKEGRMDGRKEVKEGRMEGRTEGVNKGREEGRKQRREEKSGFL